MKKIFIALAIVVALLCFVSCSDITEVLFNVVQIDSLEDLKTFRDRVNAGDTFAEKTIILTENIDLSGEDWEPIGRYNSIGGGQYLPFSGTFNGNNKTVTVSNMKIEDTNYGAFFGYVKNGTVKNLTVKGEITGNSDGSNTETGNNKRNSAGIVGYTSGTVTIENCVSFVDITITGDYTCKVGGIVSKNDGNLTLTDCINYGNITSSGYYTAGIIADIEGVSDGNGGYTGDQTTIKNCKNRGNIENTLNQNKPTKAAANKISCSCLGPIVGHICKAANVTINSCSNYGFITYVNSSKNKVSKQITTAVSKSADNDNFGIVNYQNNGSSIAGTITVDTVQIFPTT